MPIRFTSTTSCASCTITANPRLPPPLSGRSSTAVSSCLFSDRDQGNPAVVEQAGLNRPYVLRGALGVACRAVRIDAHGAQVLQDRPHLRIVVDDEPRERERQRAERYAELAVFGEGPGLAERRVAGVVAEISRDSAAGNQQGCESGGDGPCKHGNLSTVAH